MRTQTIFSLLIFPLAAFAASDHFESFDLFTKVYQHVKNNYVEPVDNKKLIEGAIKGMISSLDPHSNYLPPDQFKEMQVDTTGKFGGLGIEVTVADGNLIVLTPIEDTPAYQAGIEAGDKIIQIEDKQRKVKKETKSLNLQEVISLMRGEKNSKVILTVERKGVEKPLAFEIKRDIIKIQSVKGGLIEPDYAWLRITQFQSHTSKDLRKKIEKLQKENERPLKGIILDLRSNPGGLLDEAVNVAGLFLGNKLIVSTIGRDKNKKEDEIAKEDKPYKDVKLVTLVDESSASASEIVAGALQDYRRTVIVGKPTFGKGSVQTIMDLDGKSGLKLTIARYYTPLGRAIQSKGIQPDFEVDRIDSTLLQKARKNKVMREADLENHIAGESELKRGPKSEETEDDVPTPTKRTDDLLKKRQRLDNPKEMIKTDFQLQQSLGIAKTLLALDKSAEPKSVEQE